MLQFAEVTDLGRYALKAANGHFSYYERFRYHTTRYDHAEESHPRPRRFYDQHGSYRRADSG
jgi:hypothetical protein